MMTFDSFASIVNDSFPSAGADALERFRALEALYLGWNEKINVISRRDTDSFYDHHVLHSLAIAKRLELSGESARFSGSAVLDLGTGGGFPGIPLAILYPGASFTLCDSVGKKLKVAADVAAALGLENVSFFYGRAESLRESFDYVVSRAVAPLKDLYRWTSGRFSRGLIALKGGDLALEISDFLKTSRLHPSCVGVWNVDSWLTDPYFEGKRVVAILRGGTSGPRREA